MEEQRKATDVLLELENKLNTLLDLVRSQELVIKILSNKFNDILNLLNKQVSLPKATAETSLSPTIFKPQVSQEDSERNIQILAENSFPQTSSPDGFRRSSRPETYAEPVPAVVSRKSAQEMSEKTMPIQLPPGMNKQQVSGLVPPPGRTVALKSEEITFPEHVTDSNLELKSENKIPVMQRCVDKNSKAILLADVEIVNTATMQPAFKTRTNGAGKWQAPLAVGIYRVTIRKRENISKEKIESVQNIQVDGSVSKLELPILIIK